jgi:hypothetical protein
MPKRQPRKVVIPAPAAAPRPGRNVRAAALSPQAAAQLLRGVAAANAQQPQLVRPVQPQPVQPAPRGLLGGTGGLLGPLGYGRP